MKNKSTRVIILVMIALVGISILVSQRYYKNVNESNDPRIVNARLLYEDYNTYAQQNDFVKVFGLLDSIEGIYAAIEHYKHSYEIGVLYNNRAAAYLTLALYKDSMQLPHENIFYRKWSKDSLLNLSMQSVNKSIELYEKWLQNYEGLSATEIESGIKEVFLKGLHSYSTDMQNLYLKKRVKEIETAQLETKRRLSVSYTNLGIVQRHKEAFKEAIICYEKAIKLWDQNLSAENNLNILLGRPLKKRNFIQKMFPPERTE